VEVTNSIQVIFAAIGAVIFLFIMDSYFRGQEERAEAASGRSEEPMTEASVSGPSRIEVRNEGDEPNLAA
jgi:hypothetical protein